MPTVWALDLKKMFFSCRNNDLNEGLFITVVFQFALCYCLSANLLLILCIC